MQPASSRPTPSPISPKKAYRGLYSVKIFQNELIKESKTQFLHKYSQTNITLQSSSAHKDGAQGAPPQRRPKRRRIT